MKEEPLRIGAKLHVLLGGAFRASTERFVLNVSELGLEITFDQWSILGPIWRMEGASQKELGKVTTKDKTSVTRIINSLEEKNLVVRVSDQIDKRVKRVVLTKKGEKLFYDILPVMDKTRREMNKNISESDRKTFKTVLSKLIINHEECCKEQEV